jgi:hypothetical protein
MNFDEHLENHRRPDGSFDLDAAEEDFRFALEDSPQELLKFAARAARQERVSWVNRQTTNLRKQFAQPALSSALELDVMVPIGDGTVVRFGDMTRDRIVLRKDMRRRVHEDEQRAFDAEMKHWLHTEELLKGGESIGEAMARGSS